MGTNVYFYKKLSEDVKNQILEELKSSDGLEVMKNRLSYCEDEYPEYKSVHVGKRSAGWKFLFAHEILDYCKPNKKSICDWLSTGIVENEYGKILTPEEFWKEYVEDFQNGMNLEDYYKKHSEDIKYSYGSTEKMINGFRFTSHKYYFC